MSGGGGGGGDDGVDYQRQQEEARQARIRDGMARIDELFNGKQVTVTSNPYQTRQGLSDGEYYDANGRAYQIQNGGDAGNVNWATQKRATGRIREKGRDGGFVLGNDMPMVDSAPQYQSPAGAWEDLPSTLYGSREFVNQPGFDDAFFDKRAQAYQDFALPQVQQQYGDQQKALTFALARGGNLQSSLSSDKNAELDKDYALQKQAVYDTGQDYVNQGKSDLAAQKASAVSMLQATADPDASYSVAQQAAQQLSAMPAFTPLSPVVKNVASGLGTYLTNQQTAESIARAQQQQSGGYSLPASWSGSGKVGR